MRPYAAAGVDYDVLDGGKRLALAMAMGTSGSLRAHGARALDESRGEPAFVFQVGEVTLALVLECLGTKSVIARQYQELSGESRFADVAYDTVAAVVNDLCCVGALPLVVNAYFATGSANWYADPTRSRDLIAGWRRACDDAGCAWGGGESPTLPDMLAADDIELAGSCVGAVPPGRSPILGADLGVGDEIVLVASNGLHANGASLVRRIAVGLDDGLLASVGDDVTLGDAVLSPSRLYVNLIGELVTTGAAVTYLSHITGHGLLKLMRPTAALTYRVSVLPDVPPELAFIARAAGMDAAAAYSTLNMGAGFAIYCRPGEGARIVSTAERLGHQALVAGRVENGPRQVILEPVGAVFDENALDLTPPTTPAAGR